MAEDFGPLLTSLRRVCPTAQLELLSEQGLTAIRDRYPDAPEHYLAFMQQVGWGSLGGSFMVYSGLCEPEEIFDEETAANLEGIVFFGDNFSGDMVGFDMRNGWRMISIGGGYLQPEVEQAMTVGEFLAQRIAEWESS
jgi:hypothetical protein